MFFSVGIFINIAKVNQWCELVRIQHSKLLVMFAEPICEASRLLPFEFNVAHIRKTFSARSYLSFPSTSLSANHQLSAAPDRRAVPVDAVRTASCQSFKDVGVLLRNY